MKVKQLLRLLVKRILNRKEVFYVILLDEHLLYENNNNVFTYQELIDLFNKELKDRGFDDVELDSPWNTTVVSVEEFLRRAMSRTQYCYNMFIDLDIEYCRIRIVELNV